MWARFPTGTHSRRSFEEALSLLDVRENRIRKTLLYLLKRSFGFNLCKSNTWHLYCNYFYFNFNIMVFNAYVLCLHILTSLIIPRYDLGRQTPHF
jgi:hypothetical protein